MMSLEEIKTYFENQSALANFLQIFFGGLAVVSFGWKYVRKSLSEPRLVSLQSYVKGSSRPLRSPTDLTTLILDDELTDYPTQELRKIGYRVTERQSISLGEIDSLRVFDVILLDIRGVLKEDPRAGGLEVLKRLKNDSKRPYVIAVSSKGFDPTLAEFFMLANERLKKPIQAATIESAIKKAYEDEYSAIDAAQRIDESIGSGNPSNTTGKKNLRNIVSYLNGRLDSDRLQVHLEKSLAREVVTKIFTDLQIIRTEAK